MRGPKGVGRALDERDPRVCPTFRPLSRLPWPESWMRRLVVGGEDGKAVGRNRSARKDPLYHFSRSPAWLEAERGKTGVCFRGSLGYCTVGWTNTKKLETAYFLL